MATTTNFGWTTPNDTDLVKDGAAAIRTALNGVDTSFVGLKGGTTGQVLSKTSNTDLAYTWIAQDDSNAIQNAIVDAKGDLIGATANDTPARLAVGTDGQVLTATSAAATGLAWATPTASLASYTLLNSGGTALSGTTTTVSGISAKSSLLVIIDGGSATTGSQAFRLRLNTDTTAANYGFWSYSINNPATYASSIMTAQNNGGDGYFPLANMQSTAASLVYAAAEVKGANSTGIKTMDSIGGSTPAGGNTGYAFSQKGIYSGTSTISSISIFCGGTMDAGTVYVYGSAV
jgi:hypothetical protein